MNILVLSFYFKPDLCACSFRNAPLVDELSKQIGDKGKVIVLTTMPNRYSSYKKDALGYELNGNVIIHRIKIKEHKSGFFDQILSYLTYFFTVLKLVKQYKEVDIVYASSSRLFTAFLGAMVSKKLKAPLYLDIRDIFKEAIGDVIGNKLFSFVLTPLLGIIENISFKQASHINLVSGGFKEYFSKYTKANYSYFTNGIDDVFLESIKSNPVNQTIIEPGNTLIEKKNKPYIITYAGNMGDSQGLDIIVPRLALALGPNYNLVLIGDGGAKNKLVNALEAQMVGNVQLINPMDRNSLIEHYKETDFFFLHLNALPAFEKVIPSKLFEYAVFNKPIIAGVSGYCSVFIEKNISNCIVFNPNDSETAKQMIQDYKFSQINRESFISEYSRSNINFKMAKSILKII